MAHVGDDNRRLLVKLIRETARAEALAIEAAAKEERRSGMTPPVDALMSVAEHATGMHARFVTLLHGHELSTHLPRGGIGATLASLRTLVVDRMVNAERAYRTVLLDLRHGVEVVKLLREITRREMLFGLIRWCDDWLGARRTLVARVEAQLAWFAEQEQLAAESASDEDLDDAFEADQPPDQLDRY